MSRISIAAIAVPAFHFALTAVASADPAAEKYVDDALPVMYHSCKSVVDEASGDQAYIDKVVRSLVAVSLYNREVDVSRFEITEEAKTAMHDKFVAALKEGCEEDKNALLAGIIDDAVAEALSGK